MKRIISLIMTLAIALSLSVTAFAIMVLVMSLIASLTPLLEKSGTSSKLSMIKLKPRSKPLMLSSRKTILAFSCMY